MHFSSYKIFVPGPYSLFQKVLNSIGLKQLKALDLSFLQDLTGSKYRPNNPYMTKHLSLSQPSWPYCTITPGFPWLLKKLVETNPIQDDCDLYSPHFPRDAKIPSHEPMKAPRPLRNELKQVLDALIALEDIFDHW